MNDAKTKIQRSVLDRKLEFELGDFIRKVCHKGENGFAYYEKPWSDEAVLAQFAGTKVTIFHVKSIRIALVGGLAPSNRYVKRDGKLEDALSRLKALEEWATQRPVRPYSLVDFFLKRDQARQEEP